MFHFHHITPLSAQEQVRDIVAVGVLVCVGVEQTQVAVLTSRFTNVPVDTHITPLVKLAEMVSQREEQARDAMKEEVVKHGMYAGRGEGGGEVLLSLRQMLLVCGLWRYVRSLLSSTGRLSSFSARTLKKRWIYA